MSIPVNTPLLDGKEELYLKECIETGWVSSEGPFVARFEEGYANYIGVKYGVAVSSGTSALETSLFALGIGQNDEVIMPAFTIISCAIACIRLGAKPVLVDIEPDTWTMAVDQIESKISSRTKAILPVHIYGHPVYMDEIFKLREKYNIKVLEDAAEVHGAEYFSDYAGKKWLKCGSMGDVAATSFYANKIITTGEGGMILTNNKAANEKAKSYRNLCFEKNRRFSHSNIGYNFRMTNLQAAVGCAQLEEIENHIKLKRKIACLYSQYLSKIDGLRFMVVKNWAKSVYWMYCVEIDPKLNVTAFEVCEELKAYQIDTRPFFNGLHEQPVFKNMGFFDNQQYPRTNFAYKYGFYLPSGFSIQESDIQYITASLENILSKLY